MRLPLQVRALHNATLVDGRRVDLDIEGETVVDVRPGTRPRSADPRALDLTGFVLLTAGADPHAHLDKARSWQAIQPPMGDLRRAIGSWRAYTQTMTETDVADRALTQALAMLARGTTAVRSHVDLLPGPDPLRCARALVTVREQLRGLMDLELVVLAGSEAPDAQVEAALDLGLDLVGGAPHLAEDPPADLARLLAVAERRGCGVDLHTDESTDGPSTLEALARAVRGWPQNVSAGHCVRLGTQERGLRDAVIQQVRASDVGVIANPITNLYLQGWDAEHSPPRGLTPAAALLAAGVRFAAGADNVQDPFNPLGRSDVLETAMLLVTAGHLDVDQAVSAVTDGGRAVMRLAPAGPRVGARADLLAVRGSHLAGVVAEAPADRCVLHRGRLVAVTRTTSELARPARVLEQVGA